MKASELKFTPAGEILHKSPLATQQEHHLYTNDDHAAWELLFSLQKKNIEEIAFSRWLKAIDLIGLNGERISLLSEIAKKLTPLTRWQLQPAMFTSSVTAFSEAASFSQASCVADGLLPVTEDFRERVNKALHPAHPQQRLPSLLTLQGSPQQNEPRSKPEQKRGEKAPREAM